MNFEKKLPLPDYEHLHEWEDPSYFIGIEYMQAIEEGLDIAAYKNIFFSVFDLPKGEARTKLADVLYEIVMNAPMRPDYPYQEPSDLEGIRQLCEAAPELPAFDADRLPDQVHGAWMGRICGCMLGKTVEGIRTTELHPFLKATGNFPMHRYIRKTDLDAVDLDQYKYAFKYRRYADEIDGMPVDDDTNYVVLAQEVIKRYGRDFTSQDMAQAWMNMQPKNAYCTAERVAFCNFVKGFAPPQSAQYKNAYREWIGAQIRGDYFGYINPGNPALAAEMAFRDGCISHVKNGIYGEMFVSAMIAAAACTKDIHLIIKTGLSQIPSTSRLHKAITEVMTGYDQGVSQADCFQRIHEQFDETHGHTWCHTISNAMVVAASLLYGEGDFGKSICMSVETGFDTDCNGATVGSILGMAFGTGAIGEEWTAPIGDKLNTSIFGVGAVKISERAALTMKHMAE